jgi:hypothetical protein
MVFVETQAPRTPIVAESASIRLNRGQPTFC